MIIRIWRGKTSHEKADAYENILRLTGLQDYTAVAGLQAYYFTRRDMAAETEFLLITHWDSVESIQQFAGEDYQKAKYYDEDKNFLLNFAEFVEHFEVFESSD